jgi:hypothetical protein
MGRAVKVARMGDRRSANKNLVGKPEGKISLGKLGVDERIT